MANSIEHEKYLDAVRGLAILGVILVHVSGQFPAFDGGDRWLLESGARGVQLFFAASAYTLMNSWRTRQDGVGNFYIRRLFRIAPLFWVAIIVYLLVKPERFTPLQIAANALFVNGWSPDLLYGPVPGGWSIAVEMSFYMLFPLLAVVAVNLWWALALFVVSSAVSMLVFSYAQSVWPGSFASSWLVNQMPAFAAGFVAYYAVRQFPWKWSPWWLMIPMAGVAAWTFQASRFAFPWVAVPLYAVGFAALVYLMAFGRFRLLNNPVIRCLGVLSYSIYLWHFLVVDFVMQWTDFREPLTLPLFVAGVAAITALIASVTVHFENLGIAAGKWAAGLLF